MPKMVVTAVYTMTNNNEQRTMNCSNQTQSNPTRSELACTEQRRSVKPISNVTFQKWGITSEHS
jgi:hypothetical protein